MVETSAMAIATMMAIATAPMTARMILMTVMMMAMTVTVV